MLLPESIANHINISWAASHNVLVANPGWFEGKIASKKGKYHRSDILSNKELRKLAEEEVTVEEEE